MESKIKITSFEEGMVIKISGELDSSKTFLYKERIHQFMRENGPKYIIWDFKDLTFIDSAGIGLILGRYNEYRLDHISLVLVGVKNSIKKLFIISGINQLMDIYETVNIGG